QSRGRSIVGPEARPSRAAVTFRAANIGSLTPRYPEQGIACARRTCRQNADTEPPRPADERAFAAAVDRLVSPVAMEFGLFIQAHVPISDTERDPVGAEHSRLMREADLAVAVDDWNFKYVWSVEHHFLEEYSHISASEIMLPWIAARTK